MESNKSVTPSSLKENSTLTIIPDKPYVYKLSYPNGIIFYIGKGTNNRIFKHEIYAKNEKDKSYKSRVIRKIWSGEGEVQKEIISHFKNEREAHDYEVALIFFIRPYGNLTNLTDGGEGVAGLKRTEENKQKLRKIRTGTTHAEETKRKLSYLSSNMSEITKRKIGEKSKGRGPMKGKRHTEESKRKIGESTKNRIHSQESRNKARKSLKGRVFSEETLQKMRDAKKGKPSPTKGKAMSEETKRKIGEAAKHRHARKKGLEA